MSNNSNEKKRPENNAVGLVHYEQSNRLDQQNIADPSMLMYPAYTVACRAMIAMLKISDQWNSDHPVNDPGCEGPQALYTYDNNILAFCGSRGQGKTCSMLSLSYALKHPDKYKEDALFSRLFWSEDNKTSKPRHYFALPPIDPTMLGEGDSVIELILSRLLGEIHKLWENPAYDRSRNQKTPYAQEYARLDVLKHFKTCQEGLRRTRGKQESDASGSGMEKLARTNDAFELKASLHAIIRYFFELQGWNQDSSILIIQLDDTDMQMENAYDILEEVRKYLAIPNVIILMATYLKQLRNLIALHYETLLGNMSEDFDIPRMAAKYIDKLITPPRMIHLPSIKQGRESGSSVKLFVTEPGRSLQDYNTDEAPRTEEVEDYLFALIYQKTGLVFIKHDSYIHDIIPSTLRGLTHMEHLLEQMDTPREIGRLWEQLCEKTITEADYCKTRIEHARTKLNNLIQFENYFMNDWSVSRLKKEDRKTLKELEHNSANSRMQIAIQRLTKTELALRGKIESDDYPIYTWLVHALHRKKRECVTDEEYRYPCSMHIFFSIQLNKQAMADEIRSLQEWLDKRVKAEADGILIKPDEMPLAFDFTGLAAMLSHPQSKTERIKGWGAKHRDLQVIMDEYADFLIAKGDTVTLGYDEHIEPCENENITCLFTHFINFLMLEPKSSVVNIDHLIPFQDFLVFFLCNWDVQYQMFENMKPVSIAGLSSDTQEEVRSQYVKMVFNAFLTQLKIKKAIGPDELDIQNAVEPKDLDVNNDRMSDFFNRILRPSPPKQLLLSPSSNPPKSGDD